MRVFIQLLIPALIVLGVFLIVSRVGRTRGEPQGNQAHRNDKPPGNDAATVVAIVLIGAGVVLGLAMALHGYWGA